jgi:hypothetical protein
MPAQQSAQLRLVRRRWHPSRQGARSPKVSDERSVETIGLVATPQAAGIVLNAARVGEVDAMSGGMEFCGGEVAVTTCGFKNGPSQRSVMLLAPSAEAEKAGLGVVELSVKNPCLEEQARVDGKLGNIQAQAWVGENAHEVFEV